MIGVRYGEPFVTREVAAVDDIVTMPVKSDIGTQARARQSRLTLLWRGPPSDERGCSMNLRSTTAVAATATAVIDRRSRAGLHLILPEGHRSCMASRGSSWIRRSAEQAMKMACCAPIAAWA